jgi:GDP-L-fucose synthase
MATQIERDSRIFVAGHRGLVGSAIVRALERAGHHNVLTIPRQHLDLRDQSGVRDWFAREQPEFVFVASAKVGGIHANDVYPAEFLYDNLAIQNNVIDAAYRNGVQKLLFLGSTCIYPKHAPQPMNEDALLTGPLEPTNEWYAVAKIAGIKLCQAYRRQYGANFISAMPTNLYGPGDNFDLQKSHVLPALLRKMHEAKLARQSEVVVWGTGTPRREFCHVDDCAEACLHLMRVHEGEQFVNIGVGEDVTISELAGIVQRIVGYDGTLVFDRSKPDGTPRKLVDVSRIHSLGWRARIGLAEGIASTYAWYLANEESLRRSA